MYDHKNLILFRKNKVFQTLNYYRCVSWNILWQTKIYIILFNEKEAESMNREKNIER